MSWRCKKLFLILMITIQILITRFCDLTIYSPHSSSLPEMPPDALFSFTNPTKLKGESNACHRERKINIGLLQTYIYGASRVWFQWSVPFHLSLLSLSHCSPNHSSQSLKNYAIFVFSVQKPHTKGGQYACTISLNHECGGHRRIEKNITLLKKEVPTSSVANWELHGS